jgi:bifunctional oligoribonuclease and PAP phosphatase NrnA
VSLKKVVVNIKKHKKFLITSHTNPEGDALGSELAFYVLLKKLGKTAAIVNEDEAPREYGFLTKKFNIKKFRKNMKALSFDCFIALDCSDLKRAGEVYRLNLKNRPILNIDHHISNKMFGDINWVEPNVSSCSEMVYKLYKEMRIPFDRDSATSLYVGLVSDTGSFHYPNTTSLAHKAASELLKYKLNILQIYRNIYENIPLEDMRFLAKLLPRMQSESAGKIAWFQVKRNTLKNKKLSFDLTEHILKFARAIKGVEVAVLFKEDLGVKDEVRINLRSQGKVDVNRIAQSFGGGGHKTASGATVHGKIDQVRKKVLAKIKALL